MAIQNRRGIHTDFDATKMVAGEFAVVQSGDPNNTNGTSVYICFQNGSAKRLTLIEDLDAVVGSLSNLETTDKTSIVYAINELAEKSSILFGTSATTGSTRDKVVTCADFEAVDGALIAITLSQTNTVTDARFNVNGTGAKSIYSNHEASNDTSWLTKGTYLFVYNNVNGGRFTLIGATERIASDTAPVMDGTAAVGTSKKYARADHVHPSDTTRASAAALTETDAEVSQLKEDLGDISQENNLFDGVLVNGYWHDKSMTQTDPLAAFRSIKIDYLPKGNYKITFENEIRIIRKVICDQIFTVGYNVPEKTPFCFNIPFDGAPLGLSFAGRSSGSSVLYDGYILIELDGATSSANEITAQDIIAENDTAYLKGITSILDSTQVSKTDDFVLGAIGASSVTVRNDRQCTITYYPVERGDVVMFNPPSVDGLTFQFSVSRYSEPKYSGYINTMSWYLNDYGNVDLKRSPYVVTDEKYVRFTISTVNNSNISDVTFNDVFYILHPNVQTLQTYNLMYGATEPLASKKPIKYTGNGSLVIGQDGTFVNGDLWCFSDGVTTGTITILSIADDVVVGTKQHNLGHANTVDYNVNNKTLACFYTESHKPNILLYKDPAESSALLKTDENCMIIPLYDETVQMSSSGGLCWGESDNVIYFMDGVYSHYSGDTGIVADEINITKILLGRGDNDLSADGFGTFISGKSEDEYNGTCSVIKQYNGSMYDLVARAVISGGAPLYLSLQTIQGMEYDGYLYIGWGTRGHNYLKIQLNDNRNAYSIAYSYKYLYTDYKNAPYYREPELVALTSDRIFCGDANGNLLAFSR